MEDTRAQKASLKEELKAGKEVEEKKDEVKEKRKCWWIIPLIIVAILLLLFFLLKFKVTFKYNNGEENKEVSVKILRKIDKKDIKEDLVNPGKTFVGYFETYYLSGEQIEKIKNDKTLEETICKENYKLNSDKDKCIAVDKFPFDKKRIIKKTTIEALWSNIEFAINPTEKTIYVNDSFKITATISGTDNKTIIWKSNDPSIATVDDNGNVKGIKAGKTTIIAESNGLKRECIVTVNTRPAKDEGKVSLSATGNCMTGTSSVTAKATISNAKDNTLTWTYPRCFAHEIHESDNSVKLYRTGVCSDTEEINPVLSVKLNNGSSASLKFTYEPKLTVKVYDGNTEIFPTSGEYKGSGIRIVTNIDAKFSGNYIKTSSSKSVELQSTVDTVITVSTTCGQSKTITVKAVIN